MAFDHKHSDHHHKQAHNHKLRVAIIFALAIILYAVLNEHLTVRSFVEKLAECVYLVVTEKTFRID